MARGWPAQLGGADGGGRSRHSHYGLDTPSAEMAPHVLLAPLNMYPLNMYPLKRKWICIQAFMYPLNMYPLRGPGRRQAAGTQELRHVVIGARRKQGGVTCLLAPH